MKTKLERVTDLNKKLEMKVAIQKSRIESKAIVLASKLVDQANERADAQARISSGHLEQLGILLRERKSLKEQLYLKELEIKWLKERQQ